MASAQKTQWATDDGRASTSINCQNSSWHQTGSGIYFPWVKTWGSQTPDHNQTPIQRKTLSKSEFPEASGLTHLSSSDPPPFRIHASWSKGYRVIGYVISISHKGMPFACAFALGKPLPESPGRCGAVSDEPALKSQIAASYSSSSQKSG